MEPKPIGLLNSVKNVIIDKLNPPHVPGRRQALQLLGKAGLAIIATSCGTAVAQPAIPADGAAPTPNSPAIRGSDGNFRFQTTDPKPTETAYPPLVLPKGAGEKPLPPGVDQYKTQVPDKPPTSTPPVATVVLPPQPGRVEGPRYQIADEHNYTYGNQRIAIGVSTDAAIQDLRIEGFAGKTTPEQAVARQAKGFLTYKYFVAKNSGYQGSYDQFINDITNGKNIDATIMVANPNIQSVTSDALMVPANVNLTNLQMRVIVTGQFDGLGYEFGDRRTHSAKPVLSGNTLTLELFVEDTSLRKVVGNNKQYPAAVGGIIDNYNYYAFVLSSLPQSELEKYQQSKPSKDEIDGMERSGRFKDFIATYRSFTTLPPNLVATLK